MEEDRQDALLRLLFERPDMTLNVALATVGATEAQLARWKRDPDFLPRWNELVRDRSVKPGRLAPPRVASPVVVRRVLAAFAEEPKLGLTAHCRAAGTTRSRVEAACQADPKLADLYDRAREALVEPLEQAHIGGLMKPGQYSPREKFLRKNGGAIWASPTEEAPSRPVKVTVNVAAIAGAPKAQMLEDGRHAPLDIPVERLEAGDRLPGMSGR